MLFFHFGNVIIGDLCLLHYSMLVREGVPIHRLIISCTIS